MVKLLLIESLDGDARVGAVLEEGVVEGRGTTEAIDLAQFLSHNISMFSDRTWELNRVVCVGTRQSGRLTLEEMMDGRSARRTWCPEEYAAERSGRMRRLLRDL